MKIDVRGRLGPSFKFVSLCACDVFVVVVHVGLH